MGEKIVSEMLLALFLLSMLTAVNFNILDWNVGLVCAGSGTVVRVNPQRLGRSPGDTFNVSVVIAEVDVLYTYQVYMNFSTNVLEVVNVTEGDFLSRGGIYNTIFVVKWNNTQGSIKVWDGLLAPAPEACGTGEAFKITFRVKGERGSVLHLYNTTLLDKYQAEIPHSIEDGFFSTDFPAAIFSYFPVEPKRGECVIFNASENHDYNGFITSYLWDFDDGNITVVSDPVIVHVYANVGIYNVNLTVTDNDGNSSSITKHVTVKGEIWVPDDYPTIQEAINAAISGVVIRVRSRAYHEEVNINKSVFLLGEDRNTTLIDGGVSINCIQVVLSGFTIQGSVNIGDSDHTVKNVTVGGNIIRDGGIFMSTITYPRLPVFTNNTIMNNIIANNTIGIHLFGHGTNNIISGNVVTNNEVGILLENYGNNTVLNNIVTGNMFGICLSSSHNLLRNNTMATNQYNFITGIPFHGPSKSLPVNDVDPSNTVNGKPVYYIMDKSNMVIGPFSFPDVGYLALKNCSNITVQNLTLTSNGQGIFISESTNITVKGNTFKDNMIALQTVNTNCSVFENNTIIKNLHGAFFGGVFNITIMNNMFKNNTLRLLPYHWPEKWPPYLVSYWITNELFWYSGGMFLYGSSNSTITDNVFLNNERGIYLSLCSYNTFRNNIMMGNVYNFGVDPSRLYPPEWTVNPPAEPQISPYVMNDIDASNTVDDKPIYYLINHRNEQVPTDAGCVFLINSTNIIVKDLTIQNNEQGIFLFDTINTIISNNTITNTRYGILTRGYRVRDIQVNNTIIENNITKNGAGIEVDCGSMHVISNNILEENLAGIFTRTEENVFTQNILMNNTFPPEGDWIFGYQPTRCISTIWYFALGPAGIILEASNNTVCYNTIQNNYYGISIGIYSWRGGNIIYHNNFINNTYHAYLVSTNTWDNGYPSGGNYWSDYKGIDTHKGPNQNETGSDGIGDAPYFVGKWVDPFRASGPEVDDQWDRYPLTSPVTTFNAGVWNKVNYYVDIASNSTISNFEFNADQKSIIFNVTGDYGTTGFCRVTIPNSLLWVDDGWTITVGNQSITEYTVISDENFTYLYFTYNHSTQTVTIQGTGVIPEFPSTTLLLTFLILSTILAALTEKKRHLRKAKNRL